MNLNFVTFDGSPDQDVEIVRELNGLRDGGRSVEERYAFALKHLRTAQADWVRNGAAIALADTGRIAAVEDIVRVIRRPGMAARCGTLLYAVEELGGDVPLDLFVHVLLEGSYEARQQVLDLLYAGRVVQSDTDDVPALRGRLEAMAASTDDERRAAVRQALEVLTGPMHPSP